MATRQQAPDRTERRPPAGRQHEGGMVPLAREVERHHLTPAPNTVDLMPKAFPPLVMRGLVAGVLGGALVGLLWAVLLFSRLFSLPGLEQLYSAGRIGFYTFWLFMGIAAGILLVGVGAILAAKVPDETSRKEQPPGRTGSGKPAGAASGRREPVRPGRDSSAHQAH